MTWEEFESELKRIAGVNVNRDSDGYVVVCLGALKIDYFLINNETVLDNYMAHHYITLIRMLAACM